MTSLLDLAKQKGIKPLGATKSAPVSSAPNPNAVGTPKNINLPASHQSAVNFINSGTAPDYAGSAPSTSLADNFWNNLKTNLPNVGNDVSDYINNNMNETIRGGATQIKQGFQQASQPAGPTQGLESSLKIGSGIATVATSPFAGIMKPFSSAINWLGDKIGENKQVQDIANSPLGQGTSRVAEDVANATNIAGTVGSFMEAPKAFSDFKGTVTNAVDKVLTPSEAPLNTAKVTDLYNRAIRPTVVGKNNAGQVIKAQSNVLSGLQAIAENKPNLSFTDANGEITTGSSPKSVDQLSQAIQQTKSSLFKQYDALASQAGEQGVKVDTTKIAAELQPVIDSKSLAIVNPKAIDYATNLQQRLIDAGGMTADLAQEVVQHYNEVLKAFYRNPNYETATTASIDAMIANKFREQLDSAISNATGEQYGALKKQYGALSSMEKDVAHRATVWGRQNQVGLASNLANITSGAELVRGLITLNPADLAVSVGIKGIQKYIQYLNNPDVGVSRIFSEIENASPSATENTKSPIK